MELREAQTEVKQLISRVRARDQARLIHWIRNSDDLDHFLSDSRTMILQGIADDLRARLSLDAMLDCEAVAQRKMQACPRPTVHVDSFLYDDDLVDSLCDEGKMSRTYCLSCGSSRTAPLGQNQLFDGVGGFRWTRTSWRPLLLLFPSDFISHSFSVSELRFLFLNVLPDLSGRTLVDVGSRLGAVLYGGHVFSSASRLLGVEFSEEFVRLQNETVHKYGLQDRVQVLHADILTQDVLLQNTDVLIMNNVFEFFMEPSEQLRAWRFIMLNFRRTGALLVTVPSLQETLHTLQEEPPSDWVEELPVDYDVYVGKDTDADALRQIHLYRVM